MRTLLSLFILFSALLQLEAQTPVCSFGKEVNTLHADLKLVNITELENGNKMVVRANYNGDATRYSVEIFDEAFESIAFIPTKFTIAGTDKMSLVEVVQLGGKTYLFVSHFQLDKKATYLYAYAITEKGIIESSKKEIDHVTAYVVSNSGKYRINISPDKNYLGVLREFPSDKTKNESIAVITFDKDLKEILRKEQLLDNVSRPNPVNLPYINNSGDVFIVKKDRDKTQYKFTIIALDHAHQHFSTKPLNVNGVFISEIKAGLVTNGNLAVCGFYSSANYTDYEGMFYFAFDAHAGLSAKHHEALNSDIKATVIGKKEASKEGSVLTGFSLQHLVPTSNGGLYMLAEKTMQVTEDPAKEHFTYEDIFVLALDNYGNVKWGRAVKKKQESFNDNAKWSSYNFWTKEDTLHLLYNKVAPDDNLAKTGKRKKADEFGDQTFAGTTITWFAPDGVSATLPLLKLHEKHSTQLAVNPELLYVNEKGYVYLMCEDYLSKIHCLLEMELK